jgi:hypothetical protein
LKERKKLQQESSTDADESSDWEPSSNEEDSSSESDVEPDDETTGCNSIAYPNEVQSKDLWHSMDETLVQKN